MFFFCVDYKLREGGREGGGGRGGGEEGNVNFKEHVLLYNH